MPDKYKLRAKMANETVEIPLAAQYDSKGNDIFEYYIAKKDAAKMILNPASDFVLPSGTFGYDEAGKTTKIGDGKTTWGELPLFVTKNPPSFAEDSWADIEKNWMFYNVGDEKTVQLTTGEEVVFQILGFQHDDLVSGGKANMTVGLKNGLATAYKMNNSNTNVGGWGSSIMRTETLVTIYNSLPAEVQAVIKPVIKKTSEGNTSSTIVTTEDKLFLFSAEEVFGTHKYSASSQYAFPGEGPQYEFYKNAPIPSPTSGTGNFSALTGDAGTFYTSDTSVASGYTNLFGESKSTSANAYYNYYNAKARGNSATTASTWWLRSPSYNETTYFCGVGDLGRLYDPTASSSNSLVFGFCI